MIIKPFLQELIKPFIPSTGGSAAWTPAQLSNLVQWFDPAYSASLVDRLPILTPKETGSLAIPRGQRCALFDGSNDRSPVTSGSVIFTGTGDFTLCAWIILDAGFTVALDLMGNYDSPGGTSGVEFAIYNSKVALYANAYVQGVTTLVHSTPYHVAAVRSGGVITLYLNGVADGSGANTHNIQSSVPWCIGGLDVFAGEFFDGKVWDARVYDEAKTQSQVQAIMNQHLTPNTLDHTGILAHWPLQEESGLVGFDVSGNGHHVTHKNITQSTFHATDSNVRHNYNNSIGHTVNGSVIVPANASDISEDAEGNPLGVDGPIQYPAVVTPPCVTGNGTDTKITFPAISLTADFQVDFAVKISTHDVTFGEMLIGGGDNAGGSSYQGYFWVGISMLNWTMDGEVAVATAQPNGHATLIDGNWHKVSLKRVGTLHTVSVDGVVVWSVTRSVLTWTLRMILNSYSNYNLEGSMADVSIYNGADGVTTYIPCQEGAGRDIAVIKSDGTGTVSANAVVNGTLSAVWANKCPMARDWCTLYGGRLSSENLIFQSEDMGTTWSNVATVTTNAGTDPLGGNTADRVVLGSYCGFTTTVVAGTYTLSVWMKSVSGADQSVRLMADGSSQLSSTKTVTGTWQRFTYTFTTTTTAQQVGLYHAGVAADVYVWGWQLESGPTANTYEKTVGAPRVKNTFIAGLIGSGNDVTGNAKTLLAGKIGPPSGNPYTRVMPNYWGAPELVNNAYTSSTCLEEIPCLTCNAANVVANLGSQLIPLSGDFEFSIRAYTPASPGNYAVIIGQDDGPPWASVCIVYFESGSWKVCYGSYSLTSVLLNTVADSWNYIRVRKVGTTLYASTNGGTEGSVTCASSITGASNTVVGFAAGGSYFAGRVSDFQLTVGSDVTYIPFSEGSGADIAKYVNGVETVITNAVQGTLTNVWANKTDGKWAVKFGPEAMLPRNTKFRRIGSDRYIATRSPLTGTDLTKMRDYML